MIGNSPIVFMKVFDKTKPNLIYFNYHSNYKAFP